MSGSSDHVRMDRPNLAQIRKLATELVKAVKRLDAAKPQDLPGTILVSAASRHCKSSEKV